MALGFDLIMQQSWLAVKSSQKLRLLFWRRFALLFLWRALRQLEKSSANHNPPHEPEQAIDGHEDAGYRRCNDHANVIGKGNDTCQDAHVSGNFVKDLAPQYDN